MPTSAGALPSCVNPEATADHVLFMARTPDAVSVHVWCDADGCAECAEATEILDQLLQWHLAFMATLPSSVEPATDPIEEHVRFMLDHAGRRDPKGVELAFVMARATTSDQRTMIKKDRG